MEVKYTKSGYEILHDPRLNKGTGFTDKERDMYGLHGLLPNQVEDIEQQIVRVNEQVDHFKESINKYVYLIQLLDNNQTLFFRTIMDNPVKYFPLIYTPTVGEACQKFGHIFRRPRGLYISIKDKDNIREILGNWNIKDVRVTVVTDGGRILGLGDLGISGMGIPIGKLALYTACAGIDPDYTLPIVLDTGTNNEAFLNDPLYPGLKIRRVKGKEYEEFIEEFISSITSVFPKICIQWEDFAGPDAVMILDKYREKICTFNDDIQGTAGVAAAGLISACRLTGKPITEQKFLFLGAGSAGTGIAGLLIKILQENGLSKREALDRIWMFNSKGLLVNSRSDLENYKKTFAHDHEPIADFITAIRQLRPTAIIGVSAIGGAFTKEIIETMSAINEFPLIFPYSNPTTHSECTAEEAYRWSAGKAIFASGSPFEVVELNGKKFIPGQGNNVFIFPAMGLAVFATEVKRVTDEMFICAAKALAGLVSEEMLKSGLIYPPISEIRNVSVNVAIKIAEYIFDSGLAGINRPENIEKFIKSKVYFPDYN
ncbi:MAG: NAD-dependent malic enzyme [Ignavibacteria bacterium]|nr:NAD-dependent malic enzyme [Ignavibacteria bacterium]